MNKYDSIIFDLDGTLWDSTKAVLDSWKIVLKNHQDVKKNITLEDIKGCMGLLKEEISEKLFPSSEFSKELKSILMKEANEVENEHIKKFGAKIYPELIETLNYLKNKNYNLFIVSNCQDGYIQNFLEINNAKELIKDFECPGRTNLCKGENIKLIIERNNLKSPIYVGDTLKDFEACKLAKIPFIFASYGFGNLKEYDFKIDKFSDLKEIL